MKNYITIVGDTFDKIARKIYGDETGASLIRQANPGVIEPFVAEISIVVPDRPGVSKITEPSSPSNSENEVALNIDGTRFRFWSGITIKQSIDTMDTLHFSAPFEEDNAAFRSSFIPFSYKPLSVLIGGEVLFTGTMLTAISQLNATQKIVVVNGYSLPGVLNDCTSPASAFPLEFNGQNLKDIATTVAGYFGLSVKFDGDKGPVFERVAIKPETKAFEFLSKLAKQRNFIISSTPEGKLLFQKSIQSGNPVARLSQGSAPLISITPSFNAQKYFSHITGLQPTTIGKDGAKYTVENPRLKGVIRPNTFQAGDTSEGNIKEAVEARAGRMFANVVSYSVQVSTWRDAQDNLWKPNTIITLSAPGVMIYSEYEFIIRSVEFSKTMDSESAMLTLVLPGSFSGDIPVRLPWEN